MTLAFSQRVKLAMAYAEKKPAAVTPTAPLKPGDEVTQFKIALADANAPALASVFRNADSFTILFMGGAGKTTIDKGIVPRHDALFDVVEKIRLAAAGKPLPVEDGGLGADLDRVLLAG